MRRATVDHWLVRCSLIGITGAFILFFLVFPVIVILVEALRNGVEFYFSSLVSHHSLTAIRLTLLVALAVVPLNTIFGVCAAWAIAHFQFRGKALLISLIEIPLWVSPVIGGLVFALIFGQKGWLGPWLNAHNYTILTSSGLTGTPTVTTANSLGPLFTVTITPSGNNLLLTTIEHPTAPFDLTPNQRAVSGALDPLFTTFNGNTTPNLVGIATALNGLSAAQIPGALDQLSPESLQYARTIAFENSTFLVQQVNGYLANLRNGYTGLDTSELTIINSGFESNLGRSLGSMLAYNPPAFNRPAPNGINYYPGGDNSSPTSDSSSSSDSSSQIISDSPNPLTTLAPNYTATHTDGPRFSGFFSGNVVLAQMNQNPSALNAAPGNAKYTAGNATAGVSFRVTVNLAVGAVMNYNHTDASTDSNGSKIKVDTYSPGIFATFFKDGFYANGLFDYGYNNYSNTRDVAFAGLNARSSPHGAQYIGNIDFGYDFQPEKHWIIGPTLGTTYTHLDVDSFTETGAGADDLTVNSQSADSLRTRLGGHVVYQTHTGSVLLQPNFTLMWQHEYLDDSAGITSQFNATGVTTTPFTIQTPSPSRDSALIGCGLTATLDNSMAIYLNYMANAGADDFFAQSVEGGFKAKF